ncbi:MAG: hypothetical protein RLZZ127_1001 [Planctomycetota bacterium]
MRPDRLDRRVYRETFRAYLMAHAPRSGDGLRTIDPDLILAARAAADVAAAKAFRLYPWVPEAAAAAEPGSTDHRDGHGLVRG